MASEIENIFSPQSLMNAWLSPAFPVGAFAYSHGLETAIAQNIVYDAASLTEWLAGLIEFGSARSDAVLLAAAYRAPEDEGINDLALALAPSKERRLETELQGNAFAQTISGAWGPEMTDAAYPVALGRAAAHHQIDLGELLPLFLQGFAQNLVSAAIRAVPIGQLDGQKIMVALMPVFSRTALAAQSATLDEIGGCGFAADIASMQHEILEPRLFRS